MLPRGISIGVQSTPLLGFGFDYRLSFEVGANSAGVGIGSPFAGIDVVVCTTALR